ncbi:MAG: flagellar hook-associated protein FlgK [Pseudomonadota bacterium]
MISAAIQNALSGLTANSRQLSTTSDNIANSLTEGYAARRVQLSQRAPTGGVEVLRVERPMDPELTGLRRVADGDAAEAQALATGLGRLAAAFGELGDAGNGLFDLQSDFQAALRTLADAPEEPTRQFEAAQAASDLAAKFNTISETVGTLRGDADTEIAQLVDGINRASAEIVTLNRNIVRAEATGRDTAALIDRRESLIDEIAVALPVRTFPREDGSVEVRTAEGLLLVGQVARRIEFSPTPVIGPSQAYDNGTGALSGITLGGVDLTPGGPAAQAAGSGALAGLFALRDSELPGFEAQLDGLAAELATRLADPAVDPTLTAGDPGLFTDAGAALAATPAPGLAGRLSLNTAVDPAAGGNPALLRDGLGATAPGPVSDDTILRNILEALARASPAPGVPGLETPLSQMDRTAALGERVSESRVGAEALLGAAEGARVAIADDEAAKLAVDRDAELQALIAIEQAYAANAQVIRTAEAMLDELRRF